MLGFLGGKLWVNDCNLVTVVSMVVLEFEQKLYLGGGGGVVFIFSLHCSVFYFCWLGNDVPP